MSDENINTPCPEDEDDDVMVTIELEDQDLDCEILTIFDDSMVYIYRYLEDADGNPSIDNIQTDEEYDRVNRYFTQLADRDYPSS